MKKILFLSLAAAILCGCNDKNNNQEKIQNQKIQIKGAYRLNDEIKLKSVTGSEITLVRKKDGFEILGDEKKEILFDVFGTYCTSCRDEAKTLMNLQLKNSDKLVIIGLVYFEDVTDKHVLENFANRYEAYYFISNSKENSNLIQTITQDIDFDIRNLVLPFKVLIKDGKYQTIEDKKYIIGKINSKNFQKYID